MVNILESKAVEVIEDLESEPEVDDKPEPRPKAIAELASLQEEISFQPTKV